MTPGRIHLVRHAKAGNRSEWTQADEIRPLSKNGWAQAAAIAERLSGRGVTALLTSPYVRCQQTLAPLGARLGLPVVDEPLLTEGRSFGPLVDLLEQLEAGTVLCSHGDIIPETIAALQRRGCRITSPADWRKGTVWTIERDDDSFVSAKVWMPS